MELNLSKSQAEELEGLLSSSLGDMSHEIAATDNPAFRADLVTRRDLLSEVLAQLRHLLTASTRSEGHDRPDALERELARPGD